MCCVSTLPKVIPNGSFADESGEEYEDVRENLRSVGFGKNPKGDRSFFIPAYLPSF